MKNRNRLILIITLMIMPILVLASEGGDGFPLTAALLMEAFISIHMSLFVLKPLSQLFAKS